MKLFEWSTVVKASSFVINHSPLTDQKTTFRPLAIWVSYQLGHFPEKNFTWNVNKQCMVSCSRNQNTFGHMIWCLIRPRNGVKNQKLNFLWFDRFSIFEIHWWPLGGKGEDQGVSRDPLRAFRPPRSLKTTAKCVFLLVLNFFKS